MQRLFAQAAPVQQIGRHLTLLISSLLSALTKFCGPVTRQRDRQGVGGHRPLNLDTDSDTESGELWGPEAIRPAPAGGRCGSVPRSRGPRPGRGGAARQEPLRPWVCDRVWDCVLHWTSCLILLACCSPSRAAAAGRSDWGVGRSGCCTGSVCSAVAGWCMAILAPSMPCQQEAALAAA